MIYARAIGAISPATGGKYGRGKARRIDMAGCGYSVYGPVLEVFNPGPGTIPDGSSMGLVDGLVGEEDREGGFTLHGLVVLAYAEGSAPDEAPAASPAPTAATPPPSDPPQKNVESGTAIDRYKARTERIKALQDLVSGFTPGIDFPKPETYGGGFALPPAIGEARDAAVLAAFRALLVLVGEESC